MFTYITTQLRSKLGTVQGLKAASVGAFSPRVPLFCFIAAAVVAPFVLLTIGGNESNNLPWYFWMTLSLLLMLVVSAGVLRFASESKRVDISISPDHRRKN